jgi:predicted nuclease of restriction endonuclease-like (RecB) superfamily
LLRYARKDGFEYFFHEAALGREGRVVTKLIEEKEFYLVLAAKHYYSERNFARLIDSCAFERTMIADQKLSAVLTEFPVNTKGIFKDSYILDFLDLPDNYNEADLQHALIKHLKKFLLEMGPDFTFIGEEYVVQVGNKDFRIDLLMHHRGLNCLAAVELKVTEFLPEYVGKMQFYLEALDRKVKKSHENPSIGIIICATKDEEIVEFALRSRQKTTLTVYSNFGEII